MGREKFKLIYMSSSNIPAISSLIVLVTIEKKFPQYPDVVRCLHIELYEAHSEADGEIHLADLLEPFNNAVKRIGGGNEMSNLSLRTGFSEAQLIEVRRICRVYYINYL